MLDTIRLRKRGVDAIAVVWSTFEKAARAQARLQGVPDTPIVLIPEMLAGEDDTDQRRKANACMDELVAGWHSLAEGGTQND